MGVEVTEVGKITKESPEGRSWTKDKSSVEISPTGCRRQWAKLKRPKDKPGKLEVSWVVQLVERAVRGTSQSGRWSLVG